MKTVAKSTKLANVAYDIRGPVLDKARQMEDEGHRIIKLNIGNVAAFGLEPPDEIVQDMIRNLPHAAGYTDSKGLFAPRTRGGALHAGKEHPRRDGGRRLPGQRRLGADPDEHQRAASTTATRSWCPTPDFPLYTAVVGLSGGKPVHYVCDEQAGWLPDIDDIRRKITPRTRGIIVCNPNNPTGALYPDGVLLEIIELARQHQLVVFADEIYDKTLYDGVTHTSMASLADDVLFITFNGLSKNYRSLRLPRRLDDRLGREAACARLHRRPEHAGLAAPVLQHARGNWPSRRPWAATRASRTWWRPPGACAGSATWPTSC